MRQLQYRIVDVFTDRMFGGNPLAVFLDGRGVSLVRYGVVSAQPKASIVSEQGIEMGRPSFIHIEITQEANEITEVKVGGQTVFVGGGEIRIGCLIRVRPSPLASSFPS